MRKLLLGLMLFAFSGTLWGLEACHTGSWYDPTQGGEGINVEIVKNQVLVYFYTWSEFQVDVGTEEEPEFKTGYKQEWFVFQGPQPVGRIALLKAYDVFKTEDTPWNSSTVEVGSGTLETIGDNTLIFTYDFVLDLNRSDPTPWCLHLGCSDELLYTRLTQSIPCE